MKLNFLEKEICDQVTVSYTDYNENDKLKQILDEYGFAIVDDILSVEKQNEAELLMKKDLENAIDMDSVKDTKLNDVIKKIKNNKTLIWPRASIPCLMTKGFMSTKGLPHGEFAWKLRLNEKCKEIYRHLHGHQKLVVSFDLPFFSPRDSTKYETEIYPHADQNIRNLNGCPNSYQGILYVWDSTNDISSNTAVWPKSHNNEYQVIVDNTKHDNNHSMHISYIEDETIRADMLKKWKENGRRVPVKAGSLLLFNSKTIHQGYTNGPRLAQTLAWEPRIYRSNKSFGNKIESIYNGSGTTHWASLGIYHDASKIRGRAQTYSNDFHKCVIPLKLIKPVPLVDDHKKHQKTVKNHKKLLKPGYLTCV